MEFGEFLRMKRQAKGMSIRQVALYANCSDSYLSMLERGIVGQRGPTPAFLRKIAKPLGVPYEVLMAAAGYTMKTDEDYLFSGALIILVRESLGDDLEDFAQRVSMSSNEIRILEEQGVSYETFGKILTHLFAHQRSLNPDQKRLVQRMERFLNKLTLPKSATVELLFHALMELLGEQE